MACSWRDGDGLRIIWCNGDLFAFKCEDETSEIEEFWLAQPQEAETFCADDEGAVPYPWVTVKYSSWYQCQ